MVRIGIEASERFGLACEAVSLERLGQRYCRPYCARYSCVSWNLMIGRNPLFEEKEKETGGEGGIARGRGRPLVLRFAPDRRGWAATSKNRSAIFVEPTDGTL